MANADTPNDALTARNNGAQGIGLCRTEHMVILCFLPSSSYKKSLIGQHFLIQMGIK